MAREIELKAWVDNTAEVTAALDALCRFRRRFHKEDRYYAAPAGSGRDQQFRLRSDGDTAYCTFKEKRIRGGVEISEEREFSVGDIAAFEELLRRIGCRRYLTKSKQGAQYDYDGLTVELAEIAGLGSFIEIEYVSAEQDAESADRAEERIRGLVERLGIPSSRIEERPYSKLLLG